MTIDVPDHVRAPGVCVMASVSGGKDSTALMLALREAGVPFRAVFADTGWESPLTYAHVDLLRERLGPIDVVGVEGGMEARARYRTSFPGTHQRWCTRELKIEPLAAWRRAWEDRDGVEVVNATGVRADESAARATMVQWSWEDTWDGWMWRPLLAWTVDDVIAIHRRHGMPMNPLYHQGHDRVGCWPCIYAGKEEIRLIAQSDPARIEQIAALERELTIERRARNDAQPGRYTHAQATYFQAKQIAGRTSDGKRRWEPMDIHQTVVWSRTARGGKQTVLFDRPALGGCVRWGVCEPPVKESDAP